MKRFILALALGVCFSNAGAATYHFSQIVTGGVQVFTGPVLADNGTAAFGGSTCGNFGCTNPGVWTSTRDGNLSKRRAYTYQAGGSGPYDINTDGVFTAFDGTVPGQIYRMASLYGYAGAIATYDSFSYLPNNGKSAINDNGLVAFEGRKDGIHGIWVGSGGNVVNLVSDVNPVGIGDSIDIDNYGSVTFSGTVAGVTGIFLGNGGPLQTVLDTTDGFSSFNFVSRNSHGNVGFLGELDTGTQGVFLVSSNGAIGHVAELGSVFTSFESVSSISNANKIAFLAGLASGGEGIFVGDDPVADKIVALGDYINGLEVTGLSFHHNASNNLNEVAFRAAFSDGSSGLFLAAPVPVPAAVWLFGSALGFLGWMRRRAS